MDFYAHQQRAKAASRRLGALFVLALAAVVVGVNAAAILGWWLLGAGTQWPRYFVATNTAVTLLIVLGGAWVEVLRLREGGSVLAQRLGARALDESDGLHRRLRDVAEEAAIGAGIQVPALFVLDEPSINALAAGERPALSAVILTRGALERLERAELQGVVAHEIAHIVGGDAALNTRLTGALYGLCSLRLAGFGLFGAATAPLGEGGLARLVVARIVMGVAGALLSAVGILGVGAAQLLRAAISRQREYLADALAVQITRDRDGLGRALRRIAGEEKARRTAGEAVANHPMQSRYAPLVGHFLFVSAPGPRDWFPTHPPLSERIRRLYGRRMPAIAPARARSAAIASREEGMRVRQPAPASAGLAGEAGAQSGGTACGGTPGDPGSGENGAVSKLSREALEIETIPFVRAAHPFEIPGFPYPVRSSRRHAAAAGTSNTPNAGSPAAPLIVRIRAASLSYEAAGRWLEALVAAVEIEEADAELRASLRWVLSPPGAMLRVPLLELLLARVRRWSSAHRRELLERCRRAVERDGRVDSSEWIYYTLARHRLTSKSSNPARARKAGGSKNSQSRALAALFAMAAAIGEASARNTRDALADAAAMLEVSPPAATPDDVGTTELAQALDTLFGLPPLAKPILLKVLRGLARTPGDPNYEAFLRAVAAAIDCPVPRDPLPAAEARSSAEAAA